MYFPLVYDEYSSLPPLVLFRVRFFTKIRDLTKKKSGLLGFLDVKGNTPYSKMAANKLFFCLHVN